jgi:cobalt transport protein ATP-binding subunit
MAFIEAKNISYTYNENTTDALEVLHDVSLSVKEGEFVALLGHNGCGKSTMAQLFNGILLPSAGTMTVDGMQTDDEDRQFDVRRTVGLVQQNPDNQLVATIVEEDIAFGPENLGVPREEIRERVDTALKAVEMYEYRDHAAHKLSGGQKQRVAIAGIIAMRPKCIVLDEPTAMLDPRGRTEVMETIKRLNRENGITVILITHYMDEAVQAGRVVLMDNGKILRDGTPEEIFAEVEFLKKHNLDVPQATELVYRLKAAGIPLPSIPLEAENCVKMIRDYLK